MLPTICVGWKNPDNIDDYDQLTDRSSIRPSDFRISFQKLVAVVFDPCEADQPETCREKDAAYVEIDAFMDDVNNLNSIAIAKIYVVRVFCIVCILPWTYADKYIWQHEGSLAVLERVN